MSLPSCRACWAQPQTVIITDYSEQNKGSHFFAHFHLSESAHLGAIARLHWENTQLAYRVQADRGQGIRIINFSSQMSFEIYRDLGILQDRVYYPFLKQADGSDSIDQAVFEATQELSDDESLTIIVNTHGKLPVNYRPGIGYLESSEKKSGHIFTHYELKKIIKKYIRKTQSVKIFANHCYGGDIHTISMELPNVCSSSAVDVFHPRVYPNAHWNQKRYQALFSKFRFTDERSISFWDVIQKSDGSSLFEAHFTSFHADFSAHHSELSSENYLKAITQKDEFKSDQNSSVDLDQILSAEKILMNRLMKEIQKKSSGWDLKEQVFNSSLFSSLVFQLKNSSEEKFESHVQELKVFQVMKRYLSNYEKFRSRATQEEQERFHSLLECELQKF